jgi:superfamily II DNA helicase RecQ
MDQAMEVLQRMYGTNARYRSSGQQQAMEYILAGSGQVLAILRTSESKSLLYLLPCQLPDAGMAVVILPLVVSKAEMRRRCAEAGIEAHVWEADSDPDRLHSCPLIMVAVEQAGRIDSVIS